MTIKRHKVLFFDVNETLLDLTEVRNSVAKALEGDDEVVSLWFEMLLHHSLVANASDDYHNFSDIGAAVLFMLAKNRGRDLALEEAKEVLEPIKKTPPHPDVPPALEKLATKGYRLAALTNSPREGMEAQLRNAGIAHYFEQQLSVEDIGIYKPDRHVYRWAARKMGVVPEDCLFIAAHGWDVAGAMSAGMNAAFLSRPGQKLYPLASEPDYNKADLATLASVLLTDQ